jgi:AbrB family looped-hinge helix DNA binding protein
MESTKLSSKGQVIIPKHLRSIYHWQAGQELTLTDTGDGILFKVETPFSVVSLDDVAGCLEYKGQAKTLVEMEEAINLGLKSQLHDCD